MVTQVPDPTGIQDAADVFGLGDIHLTPPPDPVAPVRELAAAILAKREQHLIDERTAYQRSNPIASDIDPQGCLRRQVYEVTDWQVKPAFDAWVLARFAAGNAEERRAVNELREIGYDISLQQMPFELKTRDGRTALRGRIDGMLDVTLEGVRQQVPLEVKSMNPNVWARIDSAIDLEKFWWTRKYAHQLQAYLIGNNLEAGLFLLSDCLGHWKLLPVGLDLDAAERIWSYAESIIAALDAQKATGALPAYTDDREQCGRCPFFGRVCQPPLVNAGATTIEDEDLESQLARWFDLKPFAKEYEALDKSVKSTLKDNGAPLAVCGEFAIEIVEQNVKAEKAPRAAYTKKVVKIDRMGVTADTEAA